MKYVYTLQSLDGDHFYTRITGDQDASRSKHNSGAVVHSSQFRPWRIKSDVAFTGEPRAIAFEKYLNFGSGRAFAKSKAVGRDTSSALTLQIENILSLLQSSRNGTSQSR
jgi:hypothetical protein